jgi:hypothetical protein
MWIIATDVTDDTETVAAEFTDNTAGMAAMARS